MQDILDRFYEVVRRKRKRKHYTQRNLADRLHVSLRSVMDIENGHTVPRLDTVIAICLELDISLDAILFPEAAASIHSKAASDFLSGKSEQDIQKYISLCQLVEELYSVKAKNHSLIQKQSRRTLDYSLFIGSASLRLALVL